MFRTYSAIVAAMALWLPTAAAGQSGPTGISGIVKDDSGAVIPGASIRIINEGAGVAVDLFSDEQGAYRALDLEPGRYRVETTLGGFETAVNRVVLEAGQTAVGSERSTPAIALPSRRARVPRGIWSLTGTPCSTRGLASGRQMAGRSRCGPATC